MSNVTKWGDWKWKIVSVYCGTYASDWVCRECNSFNDSELDKCSCGEKKGEICGESYPLESVQAAFFIGGGQIREEVELLYSKNGLFVPNRNKHDILTFANVPDMEEMFSIKGVLNNVNDNIHGGVTIFISSIIDGSIWRQPAFSQKVIQLNEPIEVPFVQRIGDRNLTIKINLNPFEKLTTKQTGELCSLATICDQMQRANDELLRRSECVMCLDNSTFGVTRCPVADGTTVNLPCQDKQHPDMTAFQLREHARQDVDDAIKIKGGHEMLRNSAFLACALIRVLQSIQLELVAADKDNSAQDCATEFKNRFNVDGSDSQKLLRTFMRELTTTHTERRVYRYDQRVLLCMGTSTSTGCPCLNLKTSNEGEQQNMACRPACHSIIRLRLIDRLKTMALDPNVSLQQYNAFMHSISQEEQDCEDGGMFVAKCMHALMCSCHEWQNCGGNGTNRIGLRTSTGKAQEKVNASSRVYEQCTSKQQNRVYEQCIGKAVNFMSCDSAYTEQEGANLREAVKMLYEHIAVAMGPIEKADWASIHLFLAGGASQDVDLVYSSGNGGDKKEELSIDREERKYNAIVQARQCGGHCTGGQYNTNPCHTLQLQTVNGVLVKHKQTTNLGVNETTSDNIIAYNNTDAKIEMEKDVFCHTEADAIQVRSENLVTQMLKKSTSTHTSKSDIWKQCASAWTDICAHGICCDQIVKPKALVTQENMDGFYVVSMSTTIEQGDSKGLAYCMCDTSRKLLNNNKKYKEGGEFAICATKFDTTDHLIQLGVRVRRVIQDQGGLRGAEQVKLAILKGTNSIPLFKECLKTGDTSKINVSDYSSVVLDLHGRGTKAPPTPENHLKYQRDTFDGLIHPHEKNLKKVDPEWAALIQTLYVNMSRVCTTANSFPEKLHDHDLADLFP